MLLLSWHCSLVPSWLGLDEQVFNAAGCTRKPKKGRGSHARSGSGAKSALGGAGRVFVMQEAHFWKQMRGLGCILQKTSDRIQ